MKRIIPFSKFFLPAAILSGALAIFGIAGLLTQGFNLGVDFQAGLIQEVQFAPPALRLYYSGLGNASVSMGRTGLSIVISGSGVEGSTRDFPLASYPSVDALVSALSSVEGLRAEAAGGNIQSAWLLQSAQANPRLSSAEAFVIHYLSPEAAPVDIGQVRSSLSPLGTVSVQNLGEDRERRFMIRLQDSDIEGGGVPADKIIAALEESFGEGGVAVSRSDYVGSRFSKQLTDQAGILLGLTLLLILVYASIRFKPQFAVGAVLAIIHDGLIITAFVVWSRMEFNTTTIAAILTILGYSINDTIVIFDRIRETRRIYPDDNFVDVLNRALTETLSRTIITTVTTMLAVVCLFIFTTGSMKDFALCLIIGMVSGVYSTIFIASGFVNLWDLRAKRRAAKKLSALPAKA
jgi:preprotein translocase subunit SecF